MRMTLILTALLLATLASTPALAMAPVIGELPSPVVGNAENATGPNQFVFPDAINLNTFATDDNITTSSELIWSYEVVGDPIYKINGHDPIDVSTENPNKPLDKQINKTVLNGEIDKDHNPATITIRNVKISPLNTTTSDTVSTSPNDPRAASQILTLIASDGASYSEKSIICYTDIGGADRMSPSYPGWDPGCKCFFPRPGYDFEGSTQGWNHDNAATGVIPSFTGSALCLTTPLTGINVGYWSNKLGELEVIDGYVYHLRAKMVGSQATPGHTPFWDITISNPTVLSAMGDPAPFHGANAYGCDAYFLDNRGGANAVTTTPRVFEVWWAPPAIATPQWKAGAFTSAMAAEMKSQITFRVLDADNCPAITANEDFGSICMNEMLIDRYPLSSMQPAEPQPVWSVTDFKPANEAGTGNVRVTSVSQAQVEFTSGTLTVTPTVTGNKSVELIDVFPAADLKDQSDPNANPLDLADDFPIRWESDTLYQITVDLAAKDANSAANPPDALFLGMTSPTNEVNYLSMATASPNFIAMPKTGPAQTYMAFYYSQQETKSGDPSHHYLRPVLQFANNGMLTQGDNSGGIKITRFAVQKVKFNEDVR